MESSAKLESLKQLSYSAISSAEAALAAAGDGTIPPGTSTSTTTSDLHALLSNVAATAAAPGASDPGMNMDDMANGSGTPNIASLPVMNGKMSAPDQDSQGDSMGVGSALLPPWMQVRQ
ncbi:hypothetical protein HDU96_009416 [Phlyctochytrium bullatum]|nr:hypothetical protein HDU96_009416 [Phlyctochytrium bullatum]